MTPDPMRATAERLARDVYDQYRKDNGDLYFPLSSQGEDDRERAILCVLAGMAHRDRTAEREAARKAWDAAAERRYGPGWPVHSSSDKARDAYLAAEFDAGERVTLIPCATCGMDLSGLDVVQYDSDPTPRHSDPRHCIAALSDAVKRLAEQRGAEQ